MKELLEAGVHFGHQTKKWNPKMGSYIFGQRNGIYIIDLKKTAHELTDAYNFVKDSVADGADVLFVGTKKQAHDVISENAIRSGSFYVNERWLGGMLTNYKTIRKRIDRLVWLESIEADGSIQLRPKKEVILLKKEMDKLKKYLGGIQNMKKSPDIVFVVDPKKEENAVKEAKKLGIPVVAMVDTDGDPDCVDYCIPSNDDAIKAIKLIVSKIADAVVEGRSISAGGKKAEEEVKEETTEEVE